LVGEEFAVKLMDKSFIGYSETSSPIRVEAPQLNLFLKALGETNPFFHDSAAAKAAGYRDVTIPPTYLFCLQMMTPPDSYAFYDRLGIHTGRMLHGEQGFRYHIPICLGDVLTFHAKITNIYEKKGGALTMVERETRVLNEVQQHMADITTINIIRNDLGL